MKHGRDPQATPQGASCRVRRHGPLRGSCIQYSGVSEERVEPQPGPTKDKSMKGLILAQSERWRRGLGMQVERESPQGRVKWRKGE